LRRINLNSIKKSIIYYELESEGPHTNEWPLFGNKWKASQEANQTEPGPQFLSRLSSPKAHQGTTYRQTNTPQCIDTNALIYPKNKGTTAKAEIETHKYQLGQSMNAKSATFKVQQWIPVLRRETTFIKTTFFKRRISALTSVSLKLQKVSPLNRIEGSDFRPSLEDARTLSKKQWHLCVNEAELFLQSRRILARVWSNKKTPFFADPYQALLTPILRQVMGRKRNKPRETKWHVVSHLGTNTIYIKQKYWWEEPEAERELANAISVSMRKSRKPKVVAEKTHLKKGAEKSQSTLTPGNTTSQSNKYPSVRSWIISLLTPSPTPGVYWLKGEDLPLLRSLWETLPEQEDKGGQPTLTIKENNGNYVLTLGSKGCGGSGKPAQDAQDTTQNVQDTTQHRRRSERLNKQKGTSPTTTEESKSDTTARNLASELDGAASTSPQTNTDEKHRTDEKEEFNSPSQNLLQQMLDEVDTTLIESQGTVLPDRQEDVGDLLTSMSEFADGDAQDCVAQEAQCLHDAYTRDDHNGAHETALQRATQGNQEILERYFQEPAENIREATIFIFKFLFEINIQAHITTNDLENLQKKYTRQQQLSERAMNTIKALKEENQRLQHLIQSQQQSNRPTLGLGGGKRRRNYTAPPTQNTTEAVTGHQNKRQKVSFGNNTTDVFQPLTQSSRDGSNTGIRTREPTLQECEEQLASLERKDASQDPETPAKIRELQTQIAMLRQEMGNRAGGPHQNTAQTQADLVNMVMGEPIPRTSITAEKRKSWSHELESWTVRLTKSQDESAATLAAVISYSTVAEIVNPSAETAFKKFRLAMSSKTDPRLSKLKNALESTAHELSNSLHTATWKTIWSSAVRRAMPSDSDHAIKSQLEREEYQNASQYTQQIRKYLKILELLNISTPSNHDIHRIYEKALGNAIKAGTIEMDLLKSFENKNLSGKPIQELQSELDTIESRLSRTNRLSKQAIPQKGQNNRANSPIPSCNFCKKPGHNESSCKTKKFGEVCKGCKRRVHAKDKPNHKCESRDRRKPQPTLVVRAQE
jgi:hypothetical protein